MRDHRVHVLPAERGELPVALDVFRCRRSTALYVFIYAIYFYFFKTNMSGFLQTCFYFGYMYVACFRWQHPDTRVSLLTLWLFWLLCGS